MVFKTWMVGFKNSKYNLNKQFCFNRIKELKEIVTNLFSQENFFLGHFAKLNAEYSVFPLVEKRKTSAL